MRYLVLLYRLNKSLNLNKSFHWKNTTTNMLPKKKKKLNARKLMPNLTERSSNLLMNCFLIAFILKMCREFHLDEDKNETFIHSWLERLHSLGYNAQEFL